MINKPILHNKNFLKLWISQAFTSIGLNIVNYALLLQLFNRTNSTLAASFLWLAYSLPVLLIGPFAATVVDLINRKKLLMITTLLQSLIILLFLPVTDKFFLLYAVMFLYSFSCQFYLPSESATLPSIVEKEQLAEANGMFLLTKEAGLLIGYGSAGFLSKFFGVHPTLIICSILLFIAFISVSTLPNAKSERKIDLEQDLSHFFGKVIEGYTYIKTHTHILYPLLLVAGGEIVLVIVGVNVPALAKEILNIAIEDAALYIVIPGLVGAVLAVTVISKLLKRGMRKIRIIRAALISIAVCFLIIGTVLVQIPLSMRFIVLPIVCFFAGIGYISVEVPSQTFMQETTPQEFMGRIWGNLWFLMTLATIIPMIFSASITEFLGANTLFILLAIGVFFVYLFTTKKDLLRIPNTEPQKEE